MKSRLLQATAPLLAAHLLASPLGAAEEGKLPSPMLGRQSNNTGVRAIPASKPVKIDGTLDEWDLSGRIWSFADIAIRDRFSAETAAMWDQDYLYLAFHFRDSTPMNNLINPQFDPESGWKGDAVQIRVLTDWPFWLTLWGYAPEKRSVLHHAMWKDENSARAGQEVTFLVSEPGSPKLGQGVEMAFKPDENNRGYVQEVRIPWKLLYKNPPKVAPGLTFRMGFEFFWGSSDKINVFPIHRYADNLQAGETSREFFWSAKQAWGNVTLLENGNVERLSYVEEGEKIEGTLPVRATIPAEAKEFTLVIENAEGARVRNLGAQLDAERYSREVNGEKRSVEVLWDGRDDAGTMVPPGEYRVRGLSHEGLGADYVMSFFNPGTPPWEGDGKGAWGADHNAPRYVAAAGDWSIVAWDFAEGGSGIIGVGPDGRKRWGEKRGAQALAVDADHVYFISNSWHLKGNLCRLDKKTGAYKPFVLDGKERPFELPLTEIFGDEKAIAGGVVSLAASGKVLAVALSDGKIALLDRESARPLNLFDLPEPTAVAFGPKGELYALSKRQLVEVDTTNGKLRPIPTPGMDLTLASEPEKAHAKKVALEKATAAALKTTDAAADEEDRTVSATLAVDPEGAIGLFDNGPDQQVKFYSPKGEFLYAVGHKGGRPIRGDFNPEAMSHVSSVAVDKKGQVWVTENWEFPRRVSVWGKDGRLIRDYIGNTGYAGSGAFLHDEDPTLAYYGPVEMKLDFKERSWKVTRILWVPGEGEHFNIPTKTHTHPHRFSRTVKGKKREFLFAPPYRQSIPYVVYMEGDDGWRPVAAIGLVGQLSGILTEKGGKVIRPPEGEFAGHDAWDGFFWNDTNRNGKVEFKELTFVPVEKPTAIGHAGKAPIPYMNGWGTRMSPADLSFAVNGIARYVPLRYSDEGAPVYGPESIHPLEMKNRGDFVAVPAENRLIALTWEKTFGSRGLYGLDLETGREQWSYPNPFPGVHGSHRAPMPRPGLLIGPLKILGVAPLPNQNGHVFGLRGNLGQDFYFTSDGLFIGTIFQDGRLPSAGLPASEGELIGAPMEGYSGGGEPFTGWFGRHTDGVYRLISGKARQAASILQVNGFDRIVRFDAPALKVSAQELARAAADNDARALAAAKSAERKYAIRKTAQALPADGTNGREWRAIPAFAIESPASGFKAKAQIAWDAENLYLGVDVDDPTPWKNEGVDFTRLFKTGDAVDLQLGTDPEAKGDRSDPVKGDLRIVFAALNGKPAAVLMKPVSPGAPANAKKTYVSPVGDKVFEEVRVLKEAQVGVRSVGGKYRLEAVVPLAAIGLKPQPGLAIRGDLGFISSDAEGRINTARTYWANEATNLVNDEPLEAWLTPARWGVFEFAQ